MKKTFKKTILTTSLLLISVPSFAHIATGSDPAGGDIPGGINYSVGFFIHDTDTLTAKSGDTVVGGTIGQTKSGAWNSNSNPNGAGWTHNSQWAAVQFEANGADFVSATGKTKAVLTFTLSDVDAGKDWDPAMTIWSGIDNDPCPASGPCSSNGQNHHWYDNTNSVNGTTWAEDLTFLGYDTDANTATFTTGVVDVTNNPGFTIAYAGVVVPTAGNGDPVDYQLSVSVQAVPIPASALLFGSAIGIGLLVSRRRRQQWMPFAA